LAAELRTHRPGELKHTPGNSEIPQDVTLSPRPPSRGWEGKNKEKKKSGRREGMTEKEGRGTH